MDEKTIVERINEKLNEKNVVTFGDLKDMGIPRDIFGNEGWIAESLVAKLTDALGRDYRVWALKSNVNVTRFITNKEIVVGYLKDLAEIYEDGESDKVFHNVNKLNDVLPNDISTEILNELIQEGIVEVRIRADFDCMVRLKEPTAE